MLGRKAVLLVVLFFLPQPQAKLEGGEIWEEWTVQEKRAWIYERLVGPVQNPALRQAYTKKLAVMDHVALDRTIASQFRQAAYLQQLAAQRAQAAARWQQGVGTVGYRPVITWLPLGTNFTAGAVVSPDRRSVRMSLSPIFSSIPRVDSFNYKTGQMRNIYRQAPVHPRVPTPSGAPQQRPTHSWYSKIRTLR